MVDGTQNTVSDNTSSLDGTMSGTPTPTKPSAPVSNTSLTPSSSAHGLSAENIIDLSQPESSSSKPLVQSHLSRRVSTSEGTPLQHPIPKPRSNSALQSSRPAPPSPAPSRPASQIYSPGTASPVPSSPGKEPRRDRAGSTSSSRGGGAGIGRRPSGGAPGNRASSKPRPRSALGSSFIAPDEPSEPSSLRDSPIITPNSSGPVTPSAALPDSSLTTTAIPEHPSPRSSTEPNAPAQSDTPIDPEGTPKTATSPTATSPTAASTISTPGLPPVTIRDFAFSPSDPRFAGPGLPLSAPDQPSRQNSRWFGGSDESGSSKRGWSGFGFMSFRNFMRKKDPTDPSSSGDDLGLDDEEREEEYPIAIPDHDEDDYAFSSDSGLEEDEPWGLYRAVYPFEAVGEHEIGLEEGDLVDLRGRGGGDGWVVGVRRTLNLEGKLVGEAEDGEEKEGLVPESYLEKVDLKILLRERERLGSNGVDKINTDELKHQETIPEEGEEVSTPTVATTKLGSMEGMRTKVDGVDGASSKPDGVDGSAKEDGIEPTEVDGERTTGGVTNTEAVK